LRAVEPSDHAIGRSRGGLTTKVHLASDGQGRPLALHVTAGNVNDTTELGALLDRIRVARPDPGRPRTRPDRLVADKGYSSRPNRQMLRRRGIKVTIPERDDQLGHRRRRGPRGGRPYRFDPAVYKARNVVERCFNRFKQWRGLATRYDKIATNYTGALTLAALLMWTAQ
jgi:transposase